MKILHIIDRFNPFLGQEINFISKNSDPKIELTILTSKSLQTWNLKYNTSIIDADNQLVENFNCKIIRISTFFEKGEKIWLNKLTHEIKIIKPDVIYVHGVEYISFFRVLFLSLYVKSFKLVTDTHSLPIFTKGSIFRLIYYAILRFTIFKLVNNQNLTVFYTAEENKNLLINIYKIKKALVKPFPIGADLSSFYYDASDRIAFRKMFNISENEFLILFTGRLTISKSPHLILEALKLIEDDVINISITVIFVGYTDLDYLKSHVEKIFLKKIKLLVFPNVPSIELKSYFSAADLAVYPKETTLSSLECQACCLPVIMEENFTNRERIKHGGLLYLSNNIIDLSLKIKELIMDDTYRKSLGLSGFNFVKQEYNYKNILKNMEQILFSLKCHE
jgi:glycosyltransferase involved in cell wall biosynthesis